MYTPALSYLFSRTTRPSRRNIGTEDRRLLASYLLMAEKDDMLRSRTRASPDDDDVEAQVSLNGKSAQKALEIRSLGLLRKKLLSTHHTWALLPISSRVVASIAFFLLLIHMVLGTLDLLFHYNEANLSDRRKSTTFAVVINTYKRPQKLREAVSHYADTCGRKFGVDQVFIVWAEQGTTPPQVASLFMSGSTTNDALIQNRADVQVLKVAKDSLNSRFEPIEQLKSDAIFMVDDDVRVSCPTLLMGFQAWTAFPEAMVGYYPRLASPRRHASGGDGKYVYHGWPTVFFRSSFNFVLTKASFLHKQYLAIYSHKNEHPQEILDYVDTHKNCEDVAMSLLVANYTRAKNGKPAYPIYVEGSVSDKGLFGGISTGSGHMATRSECLSDLSKVYEKRGWGEPLSYEKSLIEQSWVHHYPGYWWQYRPSNVFEWGALGNSLS
jgi:Glycosyl transferase family 64 domain